MLFMAPRLWSTLVQDPTSAVACDKSSACFYLLEQVTYLSKLCHEVGASQLAVALTEKYSPLPARNRLKILLMFWPECSGLLQGEDRSSPGTCSAYTTYICISVSPWFVRGSSTDVTRSCVEGHSTVWSCTGHNSVYRYPSYTNKQNT